MEDIMRKIEQYEKEPLITYAKRYHLDDEIIDKYGIHLYHGIRFDRLNRFESIIQSGSILCGKEINQVFTSKDGEKKYLYISPFDTENCNMGEYVSVMPYEEDMEYDVFVKRNIYFAIRASIDAYKTKYLNFDDYEKLRKLDIKFNNLYSYARNEYLVKDRIPLSKVDYIGINPNYYDGDYNNDVSEIINILEYYKCPIPLKNGLTLETIYCYEEEKKLIITYM